MSLNKLIATSVKWSAVSMFGRQGTQFLATVVLARLLSPSDFGLLGMAMVIIGFVTLFKDLGIVSVIIQRKHVSDDLQSSLFWVTTVSGVVMAAIIVISAGLVGRYYHEPKITPILQVLSISFVLSALGAFQQAILEKDLGFKKLARVEIASIALGAVVAIVSALRGFGVWSLVAQVTVTSLTTTVLLWIGSVWRPRLVFLWSEVISIKQYSLNLVGFNVFNYFARNTDSLLIGRFLGSQSLGLYSLAYRTMFFPLQAISDVIGRVMFPIYAGIQDDDAMIRHYYLKVTATIASITFPMMMAAIVLAEPFVLTVLGNQWTEIVPLISILAPAGMTQSIITAVGAIYLSKGRTDLLFRWGMLSGVAVIVAIIIGLNWGITGVGISYALVTFLLAYPAVWIPFRLIGLSVPRLLRVLWLPFLGSAIMASTMGMIKHSLPSSLGPALVLVIVGTSGLCIYIFFSWMFNRGQMREIWNSLSARRTLGAEG